MDLAMRFLCFALLASILTGSTFGYYFFRSRIPNGYQIPHPCNSEYIWRGVGHQLYLGGGPRNPFGLAFAANGFQWNKTICEMDSDMDGLTNGFELGDPNCTWTPGSEPERTTNLSHPGICEPLDSANCTGRQDFVNCTVLCDGVYEEGVFRHTVSLSSAVNVSEEAMVHQCMVFDFPQDDDYHLVALAPHVDNFALLKQIVVFGCDGDKYPEESEQVYTCYMNAQCGTILFEWTMGDSDICLNPEAGIRIGNNSVAHKRGLIELHLYNSGNEAATDMSGVNFFLTPNRRSYDAAIFYFGQTYLNIPPGQEDYSVMGGCGSSCTMAKMAGTIQVTAAFNHMHLTGVAGESQFIVNEYRANYIAYDRTFSYDAPKYHRFEEPIQINPGDRFNMVCHYNTTLRNRTFHYGLDTVNDEMCFGYIMYYPRENLTLAGCTSYGDLDTCELENDVVLGCNMTELNFRNPDEVPEYSAVQDYCAVETCLKECMTLLRRVRQHPCYSGSVRPYVMTKITTTDQAEKTNMLSFWLKMKSCDHEFALEAVPVVTGAASGISLPLIVTILMLFLVQIAKHTN